MLLKKARQNKAYIKESVESEERLRSRFSDWSNNMQRKTDINSLYDNSNQSKLKSWPTWYIVKEFSLPTTLFSFDFIQNNCPEVKEKIDRLIAGSNYDTDSAKKAIVYYGLGLFRFAKYISNSSPMTPDQIGDFTQSLKIDSADRQLIADEAEAVFSNLKQRYRAKKRDDKQDEPIFFVPYILALSNLQFDEVVKIKSNLISPLAEVQFEVNAINAAEKMGEAIQGSYRSFYE